MNGPEGRSFLEALLEYADWSPGWSGAEVARTVVR
jgi:hypothetical protein